MPSSAYKKFRDVLLVDVKRIIESHSQLNHAGRGKRGLGHITRSGVMMLCAAWELYIEEVLSESVRLLVDKCDSPKDLPMPLQKEASKHVKEARHELKPLDLAGVGWRSVIHNHSLNTVDCLNTPKSFKINKLYKKFLGVTDLSTNWSHGGPTIDRFVTARGDIAHRGRDTKYITINKLSNYKDIIFTTVKEIDNFLADYLQGLGNHNRLPWHRITNT